MNSTTKEAIVKRFYYETHGRLRDHLANFAATYNFAKRLKILKGPTPRVSSAKLEQTSPSGSNQTRATKSRG